MNRDAFNNIGSETPKGRYQTIQKAFVRKVVTKTTREFGSADGGVPQQIGEPTVNRDEGEWFDVTAKFNAALNAEGLFRQKAVDGPPRAKIWWTQANEKR